MKINNISKFIFDLIMLILLVIVYCAQPTGISFHEYAGLVLYMFFIIHLSYNYKWIIKTGNSLFDKSVSARTKCMYVIDFLLLAMFILDGLSGIMISRVIFKLGIMNVWRPLHSISSSVTVILIGIHIGLHGTMIINTLKIKVKVPIVLEIITAVLITVILIGGIYGIIISKIDLSQNEKRRYNEI